MISKIIFISSSCGKFVQIDLIKFQNISYASSFFNLTHTNKKEQVFLQFYQRFAKYVAANKIAQKNYSRVNIL